MALSALFALTAFSDVTLTLPQSSLGVVMVWTTERQVLLGIDLHGGRVLWSRAPEQTWETPLRGGTRLFLKDLLGNVRCLDLRSGRVLWSKPELKLDGWEATASALVTWHDELLSSLDASTGRLEWQERMPETIDAVLLYDRDYLVQGRYGTVARIDGATGRIKWRFDAQGTLSLVRPVGDRILCSSHASGRFMALQASTGMLSWESTVRACFAEVRHGHVIASDGSSTLECVDLAEGRRAWKVETLAGPIQMVTLEDAWVIWSANRGLVSRFDPRSGKKLWSVEGFAPECTVIPSGSRFCVVDPVEHRIRVIEPTHGRLTRTIAFKGSAAYSGDVFLATGPDGHLMAARLSDGAILWTSPLDEEPNGLFLVRGRAIVARSRGLDIRSVQTGKLLSEFPFDAAYDFAWFHP